MTDKKLSRSMEILEVVIQMITFYSAFTVSYTHLTLPTT